MQYLLANFAVKQLIDINHILDSELRVNSLNLRRNNVAPHVVKHQLCSGWSLWRKYLPL